MVDIKAVSRQRPLLARALRAAECGRAGAVLDALEALRCRAVATARTSIGRCMRCS